MVAWNHRVAVIGVGQTYHRSKRPDVNQLEMINEAVRAALEDAQLTPKDIDICITGNMELFEGVYQPDMWHVDGYGGYLKPGIRFTTGGTTGGMLCCALTNLVASGMYDVGMAIGFEKQEEGNTTTGITNLHDPLWHKWLRTGAIGGGYAALMIKDFGPDVELTAAKLRVQVGENASRNPYAHLRQKVTMEDVMNSQYLVYPLRQLHMCPQSNGACAVIFACEEKAKKLTNKPVWLKDHVTVHRELHSDLLTIAGIEDPTMRTAAVKLYKRNGITKPLKEIDIFEMYDPCVWRQMEWSEYFLLLSHGESIKMVERGDTARDGSFPINPSGGVVATNPIGATGMVRLAEAALQVRGDAGEHQVTKEVKTAMSSSFGGSGWTDLLLLTKSLN